MDSIPEIPTTPVIPPVQPASPPKKPFPFLLLFAIVILLAFSGSIAYLFAQNIALKHQLTKLRASPSVAPSPTPISDPTANWKTYKIVHDIQFGFSDYEIKLPEGWKIQEHASNFQNSETFTYTRPTSQTASGDFTPGMAWLTINISESPISQIVESDENKKTASKAVINGLEFTKLNGYGGVGESVYYSNFVTSYKGKTYQLSFSTQDEAIKAQIVRDIDQILSTFKFMDNNASATNGTLTGSVCYPSEGIPAGTIRAKNVATGEISTLDHPMNTPLFSMALKPGTYVIRFEPGGNVTFPGYHTGCSGVEQACQDNTKQRRSIPVSVDAGVTTSGVKLCDFYYSPSLQPDF